MLRPRRGVRGLRGETGPPPKLVVLGRVRRAGRVLKWSGVVVDVEAAIVASVFRSCVLRHMILSEDEGKMV